MPGQFSFISSSLPSPISSLHVQTGWGLVGLLLLPRLCPPWHSHAGCLWLPPFSRHLQHTYNAPHAPHHTPHAAHTGSRACHLPAFAYLPPNTHTHYYHHTRCRATTSHTTTPCRCLPHTLPPHTPGSPYALLPTTTLHALQRYAYRLPACDRWHFGHRSLPQCRTGCCSPTARLRRLREQHFALCGIPINSAAALALKLAATAFSYR